MTDGGPALFRLVRFWSRRWTTRTSEALTGEMRHAQHILVLEAVDAMRGEATVSAVAHQLGLDHSGASRMVKDAAMAGCITREESEEDKRRTVVRLTGQGSELLAGARQWQQKVFDELTASWDAKDKAQFAGYLRRMAGELEVGPTGASHQT
jgi:DNA-binding MarR family transcriptional regulator